MKRLNIEDTTNSSDGLILIIDDEEEIVDVLMLCAKRAGIRSHGVTSTREAYDYLQKMQSCETKVTLISVDLQIPGEDGLSFLTRLRKAGQMAPAVLITGACVSAESVQADKLLILGVFEKPFKTAEVISAYQRYAKAAPHPL